MTTEKRSIDKDNLQFNVSTIVVDIEGTTTSINFVKDTLFPYVREHLEEYIKTNWAEKELQEDVTLLREQAINDKADNVEGIVEIPEGDDDDDEVKSSVVRNVLWQMDNDRKTKALKQLQGHIWRSGYSSGKLVGHIYDDVKDCLKSWTEAGKKIYVYSSGSIEAQKLLFGNTKEGDLLPFFSGHFDTNIGGKTESTSYTKILEHLTKNIIDAKDVLFLTDVLKEAQAAKEAGMQAVIVSREGNAPLPEDIKESFSVVNSFSDLTFEGNVKRRKLSHDSETLTESNECKNDNSLEPVSNEVVKDIEMEVCPDDSNSVTESATDNKSDIKNEKVVEIKKSAENVDSSEESKIENAGAVDASKAGKPLAKDDKESEKLKEGDSSKKSSVKESEVSVDKVPVVNGNCNKDNISSSLETEDVEMKTDDSAKQPKTEEGPEKNDPVSNLEQEIKKDNNFVDNEGGEKIELKEEKESESSMEQSDQKSQDASDKDKMTDKTSKDYENCAATISKDVNEVKKTKNLKMPENTTKENETLKNAEVCEKTSKVNEISVDVKKSEEISKETESSIDGKMSNETSNDIELSEDVKMSDEISKESVTSKDVKMSNEASTESETSDIKMCEETSEESEMKPDRKLNQNESMPNEKSEMKENVVEMENNSDIKKDEKLVKDSNIEEEYLVEEVVKKTEEKSKVEDVNHSSKENLKENETPEKSDIKKEFVEKTDKNETLNNKSIKDVKGEEESDSKTDGKKIDDDSSKESGSVKVETNNSSVSKSNVADGKFDRPVVVEKTDDNSAEEAVSKDRNEKTDSETLLKNDKLESIDSTKETDDKTDFSSSTPNGTHENCKNGILEEESSKVDDESTVKEKVVEKVKEICTEQNGVKTKEV